MLEAVKATMPDPHRFAPLSIIRKAEGILWCKGVTQLNPWTFIVESNTGTHLVKEQSNGEIRCDCLGYQKHGVCSHSVAVAITIEKGRI